MIFCSFYVLALSRRIRERHVQGCFTIQISTRRFLARGFWRIMYIQPTLLLSHLNSTTVPHCEMVLSASDAVQIDCLVLPKSCAECIGTASTWGESSELPNTSDGQKHRF